MTTKKSTKGTPPELAALAEKFGIDPALLSGGDVDTSPPVWMGATRRPRAREEDSRFGGVRTGRVDINDLRPSDEVLLDFYRWDDAQLLEFQQKAFDAGFYGTKDRRKVRFGDFDDDTYSIWQSMVQRATSFYAAGKHVSPMDAFERALKTGEATEEDLEEPDTITLSNPEDLREAFRQVAIKKMGSRAGLDGVIENMVRAYQSGEASYQNQTSAAADDGQANTITGPPSLQTFAERELRQADPTRYDARTAVDGFDMVASLMRGEG